MTVYRAAHRLSRHTGLSLRRSFRIARAAKRKRLGYALAFALVEQESGFRHIFGHDAGGLFAGEPVTEAKYRRLVERVRAGGGSNGVGYTQITYPGYLLENGDLWRPGTNLRFGFGLVREHTAQYGTRKGLAVYNGGPSNPQYGYADQVLERREKWVRWLS